MSIKFLVLGGGGILGFFGGGSADFIFMGAGIFLTFQELSQIASKLSAPSNLGKAKGTAKTWLL